MRKFYIIVAVSFLAALLLFIGTFVYLDRSKHAVYHYIISRKGHDIGTIRIDRFETEDKIIYKSHTDTPFAQDYTVSKTKIELDKKYRLETYTNQRHGGGAPELFLLENRQDSISFLAKSQSSFAYLSEIPVKKNTFVFNETGPVTYLPIIENYNFRKGRAQGFRALIVFSPLLPPMRKLVTLTSIKDEYLKIDSRNIKTENLLIKIRNYPQGAVWVAKSDRSIIKLEIPEANIKITRTFNPPSLTAKSFKMSADGYTSRDAVFNNKGVRLAGTITVPGGPGPFGAVLLVPPPGPEDREYYGLFTSIADYLSKNGFCVLRFDKRGNFQSSGDAASHTSSDELEDLNTALDYLAAQKEVDPARIALISHGIGARYALKLASVREDVKTIILLSPSVNLCSGINCGEAAIRDAASRRMWSDDYLKLALRCIRETRDRAAAALHNWTLIMGKICYVKNVKDETGETPSDIAKNIKVPALILRGREDSDTCIESTPSLDKTFAENGNQSHLVRYYGYLGRFLGRQINDDVNRTYYEVDRDALANIKDWLNDRIAGARAANIEK